MTSPTIPESPPAAAAVGSGGVLGKVAGLALGTTLSRLTGFARTSLLVAALGAQLHADLFTIANTLPNMLYILVAGGVFNTVLVPHLVRSMKNDHDGGQAYASRVLTLAAVFLACVTLMLTLAVPVLLRVVVDDSYFGSALTEQRESIVDLARYCLPQVFFYGMFVVVGQILNARGVFGPMMWAPIANNAIAIGVLGAYLFVYGPARGRQLWGAYTTGQELLLGIGSTLGIAAQFLILLIYLRRTDIRYRPRFDLRGSGLGATLRLAGWTVLFVLVNQLAYVLIVRLASAGAAMQAAQGAGGGAGYTVYSNAFLLIMVPHAIVTVSLATTINPTLAAFGVDGDVRSLASHLTQAIKRVLSVIIPICAVLPVIAPVLADILWGYAGARDSLRPLAHTVALFSPGLALFTVHYLVLRGLFALERHKTVFLVQCLIAASNVALAATLTTAISNAAVAPLLAAAYSGAYLIGAAASVRVLDLLVGGPEYRELGAFVMRILPLSAAVALAAFGVRALVNVAGPLESGLVADKISAGVELLLVLLIGSTVAVMAGRLLGIGEITGAASAGTRLHRLVGRR
ncbi:murein biosynthesis integral membrane protein MurJ [Nocardioides aquiterrae]|uniref:murein biosynthesis integral membrane protein MurJ n=1 Tax=Nocardioides aquiterrae TaxID=203799 RepID=UPI0031D173A5